MRPRTLVKIILILAGAAVLLLRDTDPANPKGPVHVAGQTIERNKVILGIIGFAAVALGGMWAYSRSRRV